MQWLSDSILSMWDWVFGFWADGMGMIQEILTTSPDTLGGGVVWSTVRMIFSAILGVGYALVVLFFYMGLFKTTAQLAELKRPEVAVISLIRLILTKIALDNGLTIITHIIQICQSVISAIFASGAGLSQAGLPEEIRTAIVSAGFFNQLLLWLVTLIGIVVLVVIIAIIIMSVYGRFFKIFVAASLAPLALATFSAQPTQRVGTSYLMSFVSLCLEGAMVAVACVLYGAFVQVLPEFSILENAPVLVQLLAYCVSVILQTSILAGMIQGADWLMQKFLGI